MAHVGRVRLLHGSDLHERRFLQHLAFLPPISSSTTSLLPQMKAATFFAVCTALFLTQTAHAQTLGRPDPALVEQSKALVADSIFTRLNADQADALAEWVSDQTHSDASGVTRMQQLNQFQSQFRMIAASGPSNPFGEMDGFDL